MNNSVMNPCRYFIYVALFNFFFASAALTQSNCISTVSTACVGDCHAVTYIGNKSANASYKWSISCGTITNPDLQNPHVACFLNAGLCTIQLIVQEPGQAPETCAVNVQVFPLPTGILTLSKDEICQGECIRLNANLLGTPPFSFQINANGTPNNYTSDSSNFSVQVCPRQNTTYTLESLSDQNCSNTNPSSKDSVIVQVPFTGAVVQFQNQLCAIPSNYNYQWFACNNSNLLGTGSCFAPPQDGCYCVIIDNGVCKDTVCKDFSCDLTCTFNAPDTINVGDTALIYYTGNGGPSTDFNWVLDVDKFKGLHFTGNDSLKIRYTLPGCYPIRLNVKEANCINNCLDTICVISRACACDTFTKNEITPISSGGSSCCYDITGQNASVNCFKTMEIILSDGTFNNVTPDLPAGWIAQFINPRRLEFAHTSGFFPIGRFHAGSFCVSNAANYNITVRYVKTIATIGDTCTFQYAFNCQQPPIPQHCDSLITYLEKQHTLPSFCCYNIHTDNANANLFNQIKIVLSSGTFSNTSANSSQGFFLISGGPQEFSLGHNSGFIPTGSTIPGSFCVGSGNNPLTVKIIYYFNTSQGKDSCTSQFIFDCPGFNPAPDCCDSTTMQLLPFGTQPNCCYDVQGNSTKSKCFSQICFKTSSGSFSNIVANPGWTASVTPQGFCFIPTSMFIPSGPINPGSFCVSGATNPFTITANYYDNNGMILDSCKKSFVRDCPPQPKPCNCDSLTNKVTPVSINPGLCCYAIQGTVPVNNCFTSIGVTLSSGSFTNIVTATGWSALTNGLKNFTLNHNSGFVPTGTINPATFCVTGSVSYTISVNYYFISNGKKDSCKFNYVFDCPAPPKPCNCDSLTNAVNQTSVVPGLCCYDIEGEVPTANCYSQIHVFLSAGNFTNIQNGPGWSHTSNSTQYFTLNHSSGFVPSGTIIPASFCVTGATVYMITVNYIYTKNNGLKDSCSFKYTFDCPSPPKPCNCDSLTNFVNQTSVVPGLCCYNLQGSVPTSNCFTSIQVLLSSGGFTNIQNGVGWSHTSNGAQSFTLTHNSGFIPSGTINPASFCVTGSTFYMITVNYFFNNNGVKDTCTFKYTFDCPNVPKVCNCDSLSNNVNQFSATPGMCCYDIEGEVPTANCFTQISVQLSAGSFTNIIPATGWSANSNGSQNFTLNHNSGFIPSGTIDPASFCVTGATVYMISVNYIFTNNGVKDTCTFKYTFDCPDVQKPCNCDSLTNVINQNSVNPGLCCYGIQGQIPSTNCFVEINLQLSSGSFTSIVPGNGWSSTSNGPQNFSLTYNSGFIPNGTINPGTFCVTGSTLYAITVNYVSFSNGVLDSCSFNYIFDCSSVKDTLCDQGSCSSGNRSWQTIASGIPFVYDMVVYQCKLIVAGQFNQIGTTPANNIAAWDGSSWTSLGSGVNGPVRALAVHNGILYAGGQFTTAGTTNNVNNIAAWNGSAWSHLDNGMTGSGSVFVSALLSTANGLVAGGSFQNAGLTSSLVTNNIAQWNGSTWNSNFNSLSNIFNGPIYTLREFGGQLYAAGTFSSPHLNTARWNGSVWMNNGSGINLVNNVPYNGVAAQYVYSGNLIVGGHFLNADNLPMTQHLASWNGSNWLATPGGDLPDTIDAVHDFMKYNNKLYAGGAITKMGTTLLKGVGEWNGSNWSSTNHPPQIIWALEAYDSCGTISCDLYSGGEGFINRWVCLTSNKNLNSKSVFEIQPNPVEEILYVTIENLNLNSNSNLRIINLQGKLISEIRNVHEETSKLDVSKLTNGMYIIEYADGKNTPSQKLFMKF